MIQEGRLVGERVDRALELLVVWVVAVSALGLVSALAGRFLALQVCLAGLLVTGVYARCTRKHHVGISAHPDWRHLVLLTLVCLFFRLPAYHYVLGGQDEGVYVNMAHHIARTGAIAVRDTAMDRLDDPVLLQTYIPENHGPAYLPGVYLHSRQDAELSFQFYHLFPVWMAFFEGLFGATAAVYALTFFSWLSIVFMYRLGLAVSGSRVAALVAGGLLALNPLHAFFSKFPVTEVPALAFSLIGFTCLVLFRAGADQVGARRWLWLSAASFGCLFVTRISGFMYVPFVVAAAMVSAVGDIGQARRRGMFFWCLVVLLLYAASVWYGLRWSSHYSRDIYELSFERVFHGHWHAGVAVCAVAGLGAWFAVAALSRSTHRRERIFRRLTTPVRFAIGAVVLFALMAGLWKIYQLGWTSRFLEDGLGQRWHLAGQGWSSAQATSLFALLVYLGPLLFLGLLTLLLRQKDPQVEFLRLFAAGFFAYVALLQWSVAYGPYYARYLLSEIVPYLLLLVVMAWAAMATAGWKRIASCLLGVSAIYMAIASAGQIGKNENQGIYETLKGLLAPVDAGDLVLMTSLSPGWPAAAQIKTPVLYTFGLNSISVSDETLKNHSYISALDARFDDVFLLSTSPFPPPEFAPVDSARLQVWSFDRSFSYPEKFGLSVEKRLYLYRMARSVFPLRHVERFDSKGAWGQWLVSGWSAPEAWGTWSAAKHAEIEIDPRELSGGLQGLRLQFDANVLVSAGHPHQRIAVSLNGTNVANYEASFPNNAITMDVKLPIDALNGARKLVIGFDLPDAVSPRDIGIGNDGRSLALGLKSITAYPLDLAATSPGRTSSKSGKH